MRRGVVVWIGAAVLFGLAVGVGALKAVEAMALHKASSILEQRRGATDDRTIINVATWASRKFQIEGSPWYYRFFPYFYHRSLPDFLRLPRGSLDLLFLSGECSDVTKLIEFILSAEGIEAVQRDIVKPFGSGHSALSVRVDGEWVYIDPYIGVFFAENDRIISLDRVMELTSEGVEVEELGVRLRDGVELDYYQDIGTATHGLMGQPLRVEIRIPLEGSPISIGKIDRSLEDVKWGGMPWGMTTAIHFIGPRYSRFWTRRFFAKVPFRLTFHLLDEPDPAQLPRSNITPEIAGNRLIYTVTDGPAGLLLDPGSMSWRLTRLQSWYGVDMLTIEPLDAP
jgi:hypothetical protein